ncbi:MAG: hypothetical protein CMC21_00295 [Flavobacteriaceae bacterium]|nr:hypothetical protein [Flavobacteriaceae bacterium]|tara:strand:- start:10373 stop:11095 length:723 start_codon:yes stop_codon:yes gene_type:complete
MKATLLNFFLLIGFFLSAQQRALLNGKLLYRDNNVIAANVINNSTQFNTITDSDGEFQIEVAKGDEIIFSSVEFKFKTIFITEEILNKNRLVVNITERVNILDEIVISPENTDKFLDLKEEEFKGYDYVQDKSTKLDNSILKQGQLYNGINFINVAKLISKLVLSSSEEEKKNLIPSKVLPYVFENEFFINDLGLEQEQVIDFMLYLDEELTTNKLLQKSKQFLLIDFLYEAVEDFKNNS